MPWHARLLPGLPIIETVYSGIVPREELIAAVRATTALVAEHDTKLLLADVTELSGGHSVFDLFSLAFDVSSTGPLGIKEAVLVPPNASSQELARFWETTANNRGLFVRLFHDRHAALSWLMGDGAQG